MSDTTTGPLQTDTPLADLGPLAWVFDELRKSLDAANKAVRRFLRENEQSRHDDLESADPATLRMARQQLHQAVGALEMVGLGAPAQVLRGMEAAVLRFVQRPQTCTEDAAVKIERASFALVEYLEAVLNNKPMQPVMLFTQYRDVQELAGAERVHPADLWPFEQRGRDIGAPEGVAPLQPDATLRSLFDRLVLLVVKTQSPAASQQLTRLSAGLSAGAVSPRVRTFWRLAAAYFEATSRNLLPADVYVKRAASRILLQFAQLAQGQSQVSETLLHDLLFFCAQARGGSAAQAPHLAAVRDGFGLAQHEPVDYSHATLGRYDPAVLAQARKRINAAKESWSLFTGGDNSRARQVIDQFGLIGDSLLKLHPASAVLAQALVKAVDSAVRDPANLRPELSMEVATTTLYLEAVFEDFDPGAPELAERTQALARRLDSVLGGAPAQPLDFWMEQLYRRVSDRQTMGSVVGELKVSLGEAEKSLDQFFRSPQEKGGLHVAVSQLAQMRGVLSVLGLDQAVQTVARMRATVDQILDTEVDEAMAREAGTFQQLGHNLSALSFLVDMLNYQPSLAKKLFVFDEARGELQPLMGRTAEAETASQPASQDAHAISAGVQRVVEGVQEGLDLANVSQQLDSLADQASLAEQPGVARAAREAAQAVVSHDAAAGAQALVGLAQAQPQPAVAEPAAATPPHGDGSDEDDLLDIFLEEAREVVANGLDAVGALQSQPDDLEHLTTLRRAYHTLKGSSRMVGLTEFGEAAWAMEQVVNEVLAEQQDAQPGLRALANGTLTAFGRWADDIAGQRADAWLAQPFQASAEAWRLRGEFLPLDAESAPVAVVPPLAEPVAEPVSAPVAVPVAQAVAAEPPLLDDGERTDFADTAPFPDDWDLESELALAGIPSQPPVVDEPPSMLADIDFASLAAVSQAARMADEGGPGGVAADPTVETTPFDEAQPAELPGVSVEEVPDVAWPVVDGLPADPVPPESVERIELDASLPPLPVEPGVSVTEWPLPETEAETPVTAEALPDGLPAVVVPEAVPEAASEVVPNAPAIEPDLESLLETQAVDTEPVLPSESPDDLSKVIGPLRISIRLYNVYLNEADEWSRRLCNGLAEWALGGEVCLQGQDKERGHSLDRSSAPPGFHPPPHPTHYSQTECVRWVLSPL